VAQKEKRRFAIEKCGESDGLSIGIISNDFTGFDRLPQAPFDRPPLGDKALFFCPDAG
jgi:hypothetical protein